MLSEIAPLFIFLHQPPEHQASARVSGLRLSATNDVTVTTPGFVLIVSLTISLWLYRSGRIVDRIALIAWIALIALTVSLVVSLIASLWLLWLLWPYRWSYYWLYCFDCIALIALIALTVLLVVLLISSLWLLWSLCLEVCSAFGIILTIYFSNCYGPRRNLSPQWITHLHPIIHQDLSA